MNCPRCQTSLRPGAHFCPNCGLTLPQAPSGAPPPSYPPGASAGPPPPQSQAPPPPQFQPPAGVAPVYPPPPPQQGYMPAPPASFSSQSPSRVGSSMLKFLPWIGVFFAGLTIGLLAGMILATGKGDGKPTATPTTAQASVPPATTEEPVPASTPAPEQPVVGTSPARGAQVGQIAPDFLLKNLAGEEVQLDGTRNRVVVLVFWKIADMDSETMMPHLKRFYQENKDDADLLLVTVNSGSSRNAVKPLADVSGWEFQILLDEDAKQTAEYEVSFWPTTFFLDREGIIRDRVSEVWTFEQLNERANRLK